MAGGSDLSAQESRPAQLVARIRNGERAAEEELVARYGRGISVILRRAASGRPVVEDLYQEVFLHAVEKIRGGEVRDSERLSGFICGLARNLAIGHFRRNAHAGNSADPAAGESLPDTAPGPLEQVLRSEDYRFVRQTVAELPALRDRQLLYRFYLCEEDKERICTDLKLSSLQFNRVLHRARERFRELYQRSEKRQSKEREG